MGTIHIATLFLPYTVSFDPPPKPDDAASKDNSPPLPGSTIKRNTSMAALSKRPSSLNLSSASLLRAPITILTPTRITDEALNTNPFGADHKRSSSIAVAQHAESLALFYGDADAPEWGSSTQLYNQPRSRAKPMPSKSVADFRSMRVDEGVVTGGDRTVPKKKTAPSTSFSSSNGEFEEWSVEPALRGNVGLVNAIRAAIDKKDAHVSWVGTVGFPTDALPDDTKLKIQDRLGNDYESEVVFVSDQDFAGHYTNFCKVVLWPIFHYQVADGPKNKAYMDHSWKYYRNVNRAFADHLIENYKRGDTIWLHDYHLLLVPEMIRKKLPDAKIGFFLHTAFPSSEIFRCQAKYKELLKGMLGANLVAFQLQEYADHFLQTCSRFLRVEASSSGLQLEDRFVDVRSQPIGITPAAIDEVRKSKAFSEAIEEFQQHQVYKGKKLIVANDKLDRVHGARKTLLAYERFLKFNPERAEDTVLILATASSPAQEEDESTEFMKVVHRINSKHASLTKHPLMLLTHGLSPAEYYALLTVADISINSTQRDGMNLAPHEFVYCQDGKYSEKKHGTLILSEFAGSAAVLEKGILRTNPWNTREVASAISAALDMTPEKKKNKWETLQETVLEQSGCRWSAELNRTLIEVHQAQNDRAAASVPRLSTSSVTEAYKIANCRVFFLDYEGTLIARQTSAGALLTSPQRIIDVVKDLMKDPKNVVYVTSGSSHRQLGQIFQTAEEVGLIAENGCFMKAHRQSPQRIWKMAPTEVSLGEWKMEVRKILEYFQTRMKGSLIEEMDCSMVFRFNDVEDKDIAERLSRECADQINSTCKSSRVQAVLTKETIMLESTDSDKSTMAEAVMRLLHNECSEAGTSPPDFLMVAGDDREDECVFRSANLMESEGIIRDVFTVSVGDRDTEAKASMPKGSAGLLSVLEKLVTGKQHPSKV